MLQLRQAEMELTKGQNMLEHEKEIFARPARTWFQSGKDKANSAGMSIYTQIERFVDPATALSKQQYEKGLPTDKTAKGKAAAAAAEAKVHSIQRFANMSDSNAA